MYMRALLACVCAHHVGSPFWEPAGSPGSPGAGATDAFEPMVPGGCLGTESVVGGPL